MVVEMVGLLWLIIVNAGNVVIQVLQVVNHVLLTLLLICKIKLVQLAFLLKLFILMTKNAMITAQMVSMQHKYQVVLQIFIVNNALHHVETVKI